jgi:hypothetical protein
VIANAASYLGKILRDIGRGPIEGEIHVEATFAPRLPALDPLVRHEIDEVVCSTSLAGGDIEKWAGIDRSAKLVRTGICLRLQRCSRINQNAHSRRDDRCVLELEMGTADVVLEWMAVA